MHLKMIIGGLELFVATNVSQAFALNPILYLVYTNDMPSYVSVTLMLLTDDAVFHYLLRST